MQSTTPIPRTADGAGRTDWLARHAALLARRSAGPIDVLFLGDSITEGWADEGRDVWDREYAPLNAANFGIGGDETQHVLWRLEHGVVDGLAPKLVVLLIGTNNLGNSGQTAEETTAGVAKIVYELRTKLPASRILLLGIFPRDAWPDTAHRRAITRVNAEIALLDDASHVRYLDIGPAFLRPDGRLTPAVMPDGLHLSPAAYQTWADAMRPTLREMLGAG